jgi:hypothetical protein
MTETYNKDILQEALAAIRRLESGWRPGDSELLTARFVDDWVILPPTNELPFRLVGNSWTLPISHSTILANVFAIDLSGHWARTLTEWVMISERPIDAGQFNANSINQVGKAWIQSEIKRLSALS